MTFEEEREQLGETEAGVPTGASHAPTVALAEEEEKWKQRVREAIDKAIYLNEHHAKPEQLKKEFFPSPEAVGFVKDKNQLLEAERRGDG